MKNQHKRRTLEQLDVELQECMDNYIGNEDNVVLGKHIRCVQDALIRRFVLNLKRDKNMSKDIHDTLIEAFKMRISIQAFKDKTVTAP